MHSGKCPNCPNSFEYLPNLIGKRAQCNSCGHVFRIPTPPESPVITEANTCLTPDPSQTTHRPTRNHKHNPYPNARSQTQRRYGAAAFLAVAGSFIILAVVQREHSKNESHREYLRSMQTVDRMRENAQREYQATVQRAREGREAINAYATELESSTHHLAQAAHLYASREIQLERNRHRQHCANSGSSSRQAALVRVSVVRVIDGDTIEVRNLSGGSTYVIRLLNIDTPELSEPGYEAATHELERMVQYSTLELEYEQDASPTKDQYGRVLAFAFRGSKFINYEMVRMGCSGFFADYGTGRYESALRSAADEAARRGVIR